MIKIEKLYFKEKNWLNYQLERKFYDFIFYKYIFKYSKIIAENHTNFEYNCCIDSEALTVILYFKFKEIDNSGLPHVSLDNIEIMLLRGNRIGLKILIIKNKGDTEWLKEYFPVALKDTFLNEVLETIPQYFEELYKKYRDNKEESDIFMEQTSNFIDEI